MAQLAGIPVIAYIRVSRVGKRGGDSFISPELQAESIERMAAMQGLTIVDTFEELDASGGDSTRPLWNKAIEKVERGEVKGLAVWNLSRFSRSLSDALDAIERIEKAGGRIYSAAGDIGDDTPTGRYTRNNFLNLAQMERERAAEGLSAAQANAIERGIHIAAKTPRGYIKNPETRRYEIDPVIGPLVQEVFERRAKGQTWAAIARWFFPAIGSDKLNTSVISGMVKNTTYLGWAYHGEKLNKKAHPPLVSQKLFDAANSVKGTKTRGDGELSKDCLYRGIVTCAACGHNLQVNGSSYYDKAQKRACYACKNMGCTERAWVYAKDFDAIVNRVLFTVFVMPRTTATEDAADRAEAQKRFDEAQYDFDLLASDREYRKIVGMDKYNAELAALKADLDEAQMALEMTATGETEWVGLYEMWQDWTNESRREWLVQNIQALTLEKGGRGKGKKPLASRIKIELGPGMPEVGPLLESMAA